jgi:signal transduction histidine kinase
MQILIGQAGKRQLHQGEVSHMQVQHEQSQEEKIEVLQRQINELTAVNILLKEQLAHKEQFTDMVVHELRGPLSPIINYAEMLAHQVASAKNEDGTTPQQTRNAERYLNIIISQAQRMARFVEDLLDASRLSAQQFTLQCMPGDLVALTQEVVEQLRPVAPYHRFVVHAPQAPIEGNWDAGRIQQAIGNLLDNAIKYSDESTTITVRVWATEDTAHFSIHNQGVSIPADEIGQLFRPYTRLQATSGARQGSGLGLYITKSIIEAHQGTLYLEPYSQKNPQEQEGTTFTFTLPLSQTS